MHLIFYVARQRSCLEIACDLMERKTFLGVHP